MREWIAGVGVEEIVYVDRKVHQDWNMTYGGGVFLLTLIHDKDTRTYWVMFWKPYEKPPPINKGEWSKPINLHTDNLEEAKAKALLFL